MGAPRILIVLLAVTLLTYLTLPLTIPAFFVFRPAALDRTNPAEWGLGRARHVRLPAADGSPLSAWWAPPGQAQAPVVLIVHGRSGNISSRAGVAERLRRDGFGVLLFDYRGYGASEGFPTEEGLSEDALAAYRWLMGRGVAPERVVVVGQSLGNAPAARLAADRSVGGLVLVSPFTSLPEAAADRLPWLGVGILPWPDNRFDVAASMRRVSAPVLLAASKTDEVVPFRNALKLRSLAPRPLLWLEDDRLPHDGLLASIAADGRLTAGIRALRSRGSRTRAE